MSSWPNLQIRQKILFVDKLAHVAEFIPFGLLLARALSTTRWASPPARLVFNVAILAFLYGLSDEFHQSFVPGREATIFDVIADTVGGFLGARLYRT